MFFDWRLTNIFYKGADMMSERLVRVDMVSQDGVLQGSGEMYMSLFFFEEGFRQQIVDRQTFCKDGWQGKYDVRVKELTLEGAAKNGLKAVVIPKKMFAGYKKSETFLAGLHMDGEFVVEDSQDELLSVDASDALNVN